MEIFLYYFPLVTACNQKIIVAVVGISAHDMPEHGFAAYLDHRFGYVVGFFGNTCSETTCKQGYFHDPVTTGFGMGSMNRPPVFANSDWSCMISSAKFQARIRM